MSFDFKDHEFAGPIKVRADTRTGLPGNGEFENIQVSQNATIAGNLHVAGDVTLESTSTVDVLSSDIYNANDPILYLNQQHVQGPVADSGLRIFQGAGTDDAILRYSSADAWQIGVGNDVLPIVRRHPTLTDGLLPIWSAAQDGVIGNSNLGVFSDILQMNLAISAAQSGSANATFTHETYKPNVFRVGHRTAGALDNAIDLGFQSTAYDIGYSNVPAITVQGRGVFAVDTPIDEIRWLFDQCITLQRFTNVSTITGYADELRLEAIGVGKSAHIIGTSVKITGDTTLTGDLNISGSLTVPSFSTTRISAEKRDYTNPTGFNRIPSIVGWPQTIVVDNITTNVDSELRLNEFSYRITIAWTATSNPGDPEVGDSFKIICPINIHNDLSKITNIYGVIQRRANASAPIDGVRAIPAETIVVVPPYEIDPVYLTLANLAGYHILEITTMYQLGHMTALITIITNAN